MAAEQLEHVLEELAQLPPDEQRIVAEWLESEKEWDRLLATPESDTYLDKLEKKAKSNIKAGKVIEYIPGKSIEELFR